MNFTEPIRVGLEQLSTNKMRSFLTLLGLFIGVASVTGIVSLAEGLRTRVFEELDRIGGTSLLFVSNPRPWYRDDEGRYIRRNHDDHLTLKDVDRLIEEVPGIRSVIPREQIGAQLRRGKVSEGYSVIGSTLELPVAMDWYVEHGRFLNQTDLEMRRAVTVIGTGIVEDLFGQDDPVGQEVKINGQRFDVVGVMEEKTLFGDDFGDQAVVPITTLQKRLTGRDRLGVLQVQAALGVDPRVVSDDIMKVLKRYHRHGEDFQVESIGDEADEINAVILIMKLVGGGIAGISLLVGGIGIMNIMLVSVTERTREIGVRKAVGARRQHILMQFVLESMVLAMTGGALGIAGGWLLGTGLAAIISQLAGESFPAVVSLPAGLGAIIFSGLIGVFFGVYPAVRASRLDPVEALRYE